MTKAQIRVGAAEIVVEGSEKEVHSILDKYWAPYAPNWRVEAGSEIAQRENQEPSKSKTKSRSVKSKPRAKQASSASSANLATEEALANAIKSNEKFPRINKKFIIEKPALVERCKLVIYFSREPLGSGSVLRVLTKLGIKTGAPQVSKALSNNKIQFITSGTKPVLYELTATTRHEFDSFLEAPDE